MRELRTVLCIDDEEDIGRVVMLALERIGGLKVTLCSDSRRALEAVRENAPDLILLDYQMPDVDGAQVFNALKADPALSAIPVVFLTASATKEAARHLVDLGAAGLLFKPFNVKELAQKIVEIWRGLGK